MRKKYAKQLASSLDAIVFHLSSKPEIEKVILFGSYVREKADLFTDLDIAVIMKSDKPFLERCAMLRKELMVDVDLDLLVYTPDEWRSQSNRPYFKQIKKTGSILYAKSGN